MNANKTFVSAFVGLCMMVFAIPAEGVTLADGTGGKTYNLVMWTREGPKITFAFADKPKVTIEGKVFKISSAATNMDCRARDMDKFTVEEGSTESEIKAPEAALPQVALQPGQLQLTGCAPRSTVEIVTADGKTAGSMLTDDEGRLVVSTSSYGKGVIIVKTETTSLKIVNK